MILGLAALQASLLYIQNNLLRRKSGGKLGFWQKTQFFQLQRIIPLLPPIETMEIFLFRIIGLGFILLSISLLSAGLFVDELYTASRFHKIFLSALAWVFLAILLVGRVRAGWRGPTAVRWTLLCVVLLIVAYFSSKLILLSYWSWN